MMTTSEIAKKYVGLPYAHKGRDMSGVDCYGLLMLIFADLGQKLMDVSEDYDEDWSFKSGRDYFIENYHTEWVKVEQPRAFDVVAFKNGKGVVNHTGVYLSDGKFIQTAQKVGTVICKINENIWQRRLEGYYRLKVLA